MYISKWAQFDGVKIYKCKACGKIDKVKIAEKIIEFTVDEEFAKQLNKEPNYLCKQCAFELIEGGKEDDEEVDHQDVEYYEVQPLVSKFLDKFSIEELQYLDELLVGMDLAEWQATPETDPFHLRQILASAVHEMILNKDFLEDLIDIHYGLAQRIDSGVFEWEDVSELERKNKIEKSEIIFESLLPKLKEILGAHKVSKRPHLRVISNRHFRKLADFELIEGGNDPDEEGQVIDESGILVERFLDKFSDDALEYLNELLIYTRVLEDKLPASSRWIVLMAAIQNLINDKEDFIKSIQAVHETLIERVQEGEDEWQNKNVFERRKMLNLLTKTWDEIIRALDGIFKAYLVMQKPQLRVISNRYLQKLADFEVIEGEGRPDHEGQVIDESGVLVERFLDKFSSDALEYLNELLIYIRILEDKMGAEGQWIVLMAAIQNLVEGPNDFINKIKAVHDTLVERVQGGEDEWAAKNVFERKKMLNLLYKTWDELMQRLNEILEAYNKMQKPQLRVISKRHFKKLASSEYEKKRKFDKTPEPKGKKKPKKNQHRFVIHHHRAEKAGRHLDLRLENDEGSLSSWSIPKHKLPTGDEKLLAVKTEDHPIEYMSFKGSIPSGEYGAGKVTIEDKGTYEPIKEGKDEMIFKLRGKNKGTYNLFKTKGKNWMITASKK
jgi:DNA ligase D-like protein (predicted 3'-phosphoesterase)